MSFDNIDIITGKVLASNKYADIDDYYKKASEGIFNYFENHTLEETTELERIDTALRVVLAPHLKEIDKLEKQNSKMKDLLFETSEYWNGKTQRETTFSMKTLVKINAFLVSLAKNKE